MYFINRRHASETTRSVKECGNFSTTAVHQVWQYCEHKLYRIAKANKLNNTGVTVCFKEFLYQGIQNAVAFFSYLAYVRELTKWLLHLN